MAAPARRRVDLAPPPGDPPPPLNVVPPVDPYAVPRAVRRERAKRWARDEHKGDQRRARVRFWALLVGLVFFAIFLSLTIVDQIEALFGL